MSGLLSFAKTTRANLTFQGPAVRIVHLSEIMKQANGDSLDKYIADKAPLFYRDIKYIYSSMEDGYFLSAIKETLSKLPTSKSFQESHFGEITTGIFAEEIMGLRKLYSKLSLLSAENSNAYKMDLVMYDPNSDPIEFVFGEVKSSPKTRLQGFPVGHDKSCFADIFNSLNHYARSDLDFDLTAAKDHIDSLPSEERTRVRNALKPYSNSVVKYAGFAIIDSSTRHDSEMSLLATRKNKKDFEVDVICVEAFPEVAESVYKRLEGLKQYVSS
ncbi:MAG: SAVED domain-containing protein [Firmicutes bacterium]|nr:SAVED domain-containing protein [Bacillota bacterium]